MKLINTDLLPTSAPPSAGYLGVRKLQGGGHGLFEGAELVDRGSLEEMTAALQSRSAFHARTREQEAEMRALGLDPNDPVAVLFGI